MYLSIILPHIEALVFASDKPVSIAELTELVNNALSFMDDKATAEQVSEAMDAIGEKYENETFSFGLQESGGGYQFLTKPAYFKTVALLHSDKYLKRLSTAALETLAIIAYKQPVTKSEMEHIRGVNCDYAVQKLLEKELVSIIGRREGSPGQPLEYAASRNFMDYFGMNSLDELPKLNELFPQDGAEATIITKAHPVEEDTVGEAELHMVVNENGDVVEITEEIVQVHDPIEANDIQQENVEAQADENGDEVEITEYTVQERDTIEDSYIQEEEDTEAPDDGSLAVAELTENAIQVYNTIENSDIPEEENTEIPDEESVDVVVITEDTVQADNKTEDKDIQAEEDTKASDDETEDRDGEENTDIEKNTT